MKKSGVVLLVVGALLALVGLILPLLFPVPSGSVAIIRGADGPAAIELTHKLVVAHWLWRFLPGGILLLCGAVLLTVSIFRKQQAARKNAVPVPYLLQPKDIEEFYEDLKRSTFYLETLSDIQEKYETFFHDVKKTYTDEKAAEDDAIKQAICFQYVDDAVLINSCEPARTYTVMGIARYLIDRGRPASFMIEEIRQDLETILKCNKIKKHKKYFSETDYAELQKDEKRVAEWCRGLPPV